MKIGDRFKLQQGKKWLEITPQHTMEIVRMGGMFFYFKILGEPTWNTGYNAYEEFEDFFEWSVEPK
jgi:hypothetical protein